MNNIEDHGPGCRCEACFAPLDIDYPLAAALLDDIWPPRRVEVPLRCQHCGRRVGVVKITKGAAVSLSCGGCQAEGRIE